MEDEQGASISVLDWLKGLQACAGEIWSRAVWISCAHKRIKLRLIALRLSQDQQEKAVRRHQAQSKQKSAEGAAEHPLFLGMDLGSHDPARGALE